MKKLFPLHYPIPISHTSIHFLGQLSPLGCSQTMSFCIHKQFRSPLYYKRPSQGANRCPHQLLVACFIHRQTTAKTTGPCLVIDLGHQSVELHHAMWPCSQLLLLDLHGRLQELQCLVVLPRLYPVIVNTAR